jgi:hypothetical protein
LNGTLEGKEKLRVLNHLTECSVCQREHDHLQPLAALIESDHDADAETLDYKPSFNKLMALIDQMDTAPVSSPNTTRGPMPVALAAAASVVLMRWGFTLMQTSEPHIETLSVPEAKLVDADLVTHRLGVTFERNIDSEKLRSAFVETGAYIVSGPDDQGRYVVEVLHAKDDPRLVSNMAQVDGVQDVALLD